MLKASACTLLTVVAVTCAGTTSAVAETPTSGIPQPPLCYTVTLESPTTGTNPSVTVCRP